MLIDLRSDTVTKPTEDMRLAMYRAEVGDDVYQDDPSVNYLEHLAAEMLGKEAALYVSSGTQGNLVALMTHCRHGEEIILEERSHIYVNEVGGLAAIAGLMAQRLPGKKGCFTPEQVRAAIRTQNIHFPRTRLICLENTHNASGGSVIGLEEQNAIRKVADEYGLKMHLDGARFFNAAVALGVEYRDLAKPFDSVQFCLSKGLGAPVGSLLVGSQEFIAEARRNRKVLGGGMRQAGVIAAAGIYALQNNIYRLAEDHIHARFLADEIRKIPGLKLQNEQVDTNIVYFDVMERYTGPELSNKLAEAGVLANASGPNSLRFVTHLQITEEDCVEALKTLRKLMQD